MNKVSVVFIIACVFCVILGCVSSSMKRYGNRTFLWVCYYAGFENFKLSPDISLAILDPDNVANPHDIKGKNTLVVGYLSIGEAEDFRWYWKDIAGKDFVLEPNPDWEGDYYIDPRSSGWRNFVIRKIIPDILAKGYDGLFLDTIDTGEFLEWKDPQKYAGSKDAMVELIRQIRINYPDIIIISNNGFPILEKIAKYINYALVEDLYTSYDFDKKIYLDQDIEITNQRIKSLKRISYDFNIPILTLDYCEQSNSGKIAEISSKSVVCGFYPYVTDISLQNISDHFKEPVYGKIHN